MYGTGLNSLSGGGISFGGGIRTFFGGWSASLFFEEFFLLFCRTVLDEKSLEPVDRSDGDSGVGDHNGVWRGTMRGFGV